MDSYVFKNNESMENLPLIDNMEIMSTRLEKYSIYDKSKLSGLALKCDWYIHTTNILNITNTQQPNIIFI